MCWPKATISSARYSVPGDSKRHDVDEWLEGVFIPAGKFKTVLVYVGGGAGTWPSSGNTLDIYPTPSQY